MKITFVLPMHTTTPVGGFKIVYEYANRLVERGHGVTVVHRATSTPSKGKRQCVREALSWTHRNEKTGLAPWFPIRPDVVMRSVPEVTEDALPEADVLMATAWQTAEWVQGVSPRRGRKWYLVQDYEYYMTADLATRERIARTFCGPFQTIAVSPAVQKMLAANGDRNAVTIPNGLALETFFLKCSLSDKYRIHLGFPTRIEPFKRTEDAVAALSLLRKEPGLTGRVWSFGGRRPDWLPRWVCYHERPSDERLRALYNRTAVFVTPSHYEGWGLPGAEAMACGAALVSTDHGGVRAYACHNETALLSAPCDAAALAVNIGRLLEDDSLRKAIAQAGYRHVQQFTWKAAVDQLEGAFNSHAA